MFVNPLVESGKDFQAIFPIFLSPEKICSDKSSNHESVNETRMELFYHTNKIFYLQELLFFNIKFY